MDGSTWKEFCSETSIHGLHHIFGHHHPRKRRYRVVWSLIFLVTLFLTTWSCVNNLLDYLKFNVKTTISYRTENELPFPAITICNENTFRKSVVANTVLMYIMSAFGNFSNLEAVTSENNRTCYDPNKEASNLWEIKMQLDHYMKMRMFDIMKMTTTDSTAAVKCWWNEVEIECGGSFLTHLDTLGTCFTYNIKDKMINEVVNKGSLASFGYGLNTTLYTSKTQRMSGTKNGLRILLNVNQKDYCGVVRKWYGAGFRTYIHDPQEFISYYVNPPIQLHPGSDVSIGIKTIKFHRNTESLGLCSKFVYLYLSPFASVYSQLACFVQCGTEFIWKHCKCYPPFGQLFTDKVAQSLNVPESSLQMCTVNDVKCIKSYQDKLIEINYAIDCKLCKRPCDEAKYEYSISTLKFPPKRLSSNYSNELRTTENDLEKNFLRVNYYLEDMNVMYVEENQAFTLTDLFTYMGGNIGLFLGMSVISVGEIFYQIVYSIHGYYKRRKNRVRMIKKRKRRYGKARTTVSVIYPDVSPAPKVKGLRGKNGKNKQQIQK